MSIAFFRITPTELEFIDNTAASSSGPEGVFGADFHRQQSFSVFGVLPSQPSEVISATLQRVNVGADDVIAREGGPADKLFIVVDGELEVTREEGGSKQTVSTLGPGELYGEISVLIDRPRSATVRALKPTTLLTLDGDSFKDVMAQSLGTTPGFDKIIRERLQRLRGNV